MSKVEKLQNYFNFTQSDLKENIEGRVTEGQKVILREKIQREIGLIVVLSIIFGIVGLILFPSNKIFFSFLALGMVTTVIIRIIIKSDHSVDFVEGKVNFVWEEHRRINAVERDNYTTTRKLKMEVGGKSFDVRENLMDIIDQGDNCCFYFTGGGDILSVEFLDKS